MDRALDVRVALAATLVAQLAGAPTEELQELFHHIAPSHQVQLRDMGGAVGWSDGHGWS